MFDMSCEKLIYVLLSSINSSNFEEMIYISRDYFNGYSQYFVFYILKVEKSIEEIRILIL
jgi:hypothetical protein